MQISLDTLRNTKGIGNKTLERIIEQHEIDNNIKSYQSKYTPSEEHKTDKNINLWQGDCLKLMEHIPDKSIDMIIADPPYGINYRSNFKKDKFRKIENDNAIDLRFIELAFSKLKVGGAIYLFTRFDVYDTWKEEIEKFFKIKNMIVWFKRGGGLGDLKGAYIYNHELIIYAVKGRHILNGKRESDVWEISKGDTSKYVHPTQKPVDLMKKIIEKSSTEFDTILDPFMGSGSTGVACKNLNRKFIGIELDEKYFTIAKDRIAEQSEK